MDDEQQQFPPPGPDVTPKLFRQWQAAKRGATVAERMTNPVWQWLFRGRIDPYLANEHFKTGSDFPSKPRWSGARLGQTETLLPDGRVVWIAGEHEDHYDPDFFIYNDVIIEGAGGQIEILGFPEEHFPPTDFHSATAVDGGARILLIGNLGYEKDRQPGATQVLLFDLASLSFSKYQTLNPGPGWIHGHRAALTSGGNKITVTGGQLDTGDTLLESIDDWQLDLSSRRWIQLTDRQWTRVEVARADREMLHLWDYSTLAFDSLVGEPAGASRAELQAELGIAPDVALYQQLYVPTLRHESVPKDPGSDEWNVTRVRVNGTTVRFVEEINSIMVTVEGELAPEIVCRLVDELQKDLAKLENAECRAKWIEKPDAAER